MFLQDDWKISPRADPEGWASATRGSSAYDDIDYTVSNLGGSALTYPCPADNNNIAPRLALAFDPGATAARRCTPPTGSSTTTRSSPSRRSATASTAPRTACARWSCASRPASRPGARPATRSPEPTTAVPQPGHLARPRASRRRTRTRRRSASTARWAATSRWPRTSSTCAARASSAPSTTTRSSPPWARAGVPTTCGGRAGTSASILQYTSFGETWYKGLTVSLNKRFSGNYAVHGLVHALQGGGQLDRLPERVHRAGQRARPEPADPNGLPTALQSRLRSAGRPPTTSATASCSRASTSFPGTSRSPRSSPRPPAGRSTRWPAPTSTATETAARSRRTARGATPPTAASSVGRNSGTMDRQFIVDVRLGKKFRFGVAGAPRRVRGGLQPAQPHEFQRDQQHLRAGARSRASRRRTRRGASPTACTSRRWPRARSSSRRRSASSARSRGPWRSDAPPGAAHPHPGDAMNRASCWT